MSHARTGPPLVKLSPRIVNISGYMAFLFHSGCQGKDVQFNPSHALPKRSASVRAWLELHNAMHHVVFIQTRA